MPAPLSQAARLSPDKILNATSCDAERLHRDSPVLILLAAGKGTRFGKQPKCVQLVDGLPLARHSIEAFREVSSAPNVCLVGHQSDQVCEGLGEGNLFVETDDPAGGTAWAAMEAFSIEQLELVDPIVVVTMGDRIVPAALFRELLETHRYGVEASLTMLTAVYQPPHHDGKGRIVRDERGSIAQIVERRDIDLIESADKRRHLLTQTEGNCPLYAIRAATLKQYLGRVTNDNAQHQYYFTDIVEAIHRDGGTIRSLTVTPGDPDYDLVCADVTRVDDLPVLERARAAYESASTSDRRSDRKLPAEAISADRSLEQSAAIAAQLQQLFSFDRLKQVGFDPGKPIGIGISGGRLRIAFMHPDMGRFFGPAWQMPIGAADASGREQIVVLVQAADDNRIHLYPTDRSFREPVNEVPADLAFLYPTDDVVDGYSYESFGTAMTQELLATLGYHSDDQISRLQRAGEALPEPETWVCNSMRRPFALLANAIASIRTIRDGAIGERVQTVLGRDHFRGLRVISTGLIPQGGFSSSSAVTVAIINALDSLYDLRLTSDHKVKLACQAEYGTGVRAGALDQATEQQGQHGVGTLISSNPKDNYRILGTYKVPTDRYKVLFPYTVDRDRVAWKWSAGVYAAAVGDRRLTAIEMRKMTGKAAELAAILTKLPVGVDYFDEPIQHDLVEWGELTQSTTLGYVRDRLKQIPLRVTQAQLRERLQQRVNWYVDQQQRHDPAFSNKHAEQTFDSLLAGWRDPWLKRTTSDGSEVDEFGAPLRAMVAYLFAEVAHNCYLIGHHDQWIETVSRSQRGDRCFDICADALPSRKEMLAPHPWDSDRCGSERMEHWLRASGATPFDFNRGIEDADLGDDAWRLTDVAGTNFFRGLALIDLAEAMLKRAFGGSAVAVRVNGAGQGDYFQVHVDTQLADLEAVKEFIDRAIYQRFGLRPLQKFVETHPGGGAVGTRVNRYDLLPSVIRELHRIQWQRQSGSFMPIETSAAEVRV